MSEDKISLQPRRHQVSTEMLLVLIEHTALEVRVASTKAYTSQFISLFMFALVMSEDKISLQPRRHQVSTEMLLVLIEHTALEVRVASTKAYTSQFISLVMFA
ncbi:Glucosamine--fructose-6-phosphate aminotransferase 1, partial [Homalodisca vitripennis]